MENNELEKMFAHFQQFEQANKKSVNFIYVNSSTYEKLKELGELTYETGANDLVKYYSSVQLAIDDELEDGQVSVG